MRHRDTADVDEVFGAPTSGCFGRKDRLSTRWMFRVAPGKSVFECYIEYVPSLFTSFIGGALALTLCACAQRAVQRPAEPPPRALEPRTEVTPKERTRRGPELIAPPPAYGNKIVMAKADSRTLPN